MLYRICRRDTNVRFMCAPSRALASGNLTIICGMPNFQLITRVCKAGSSLEPRSRAATLHGFLFLSFYPFWSCKTRLQGLFRRNDWSGAGVRLEAPGALLAQFPVAVACNFTLFVVSAQCCSLGRSAAAPIVVLPAPSHCSRFRCWRWRRQAKMNYHWHRGAHEKVRCSRNVHSQGWVRRSAATSPFCTHLGIAVVLCPVQRLQQ